LPGPVGAPGPEDPQLALVGLAGPHHAGGAKFLPGLAWVLLEGEPGGRLHLVAAGGVAGVGRVDRHRAGAAADEVDRDALAGQAVGVTAVEGAGDGGAVLRGELHGLGPPTRPPPPP